jgi:hypothetical protein
VIFYEADKNHMPSLMTISLIWDDQFKHTVVLRLENKASSNGCCKDVQYVINYWPHSLGGLVMGLTTTYREPLSRLRMPHLDS